MKKKEENKIKREKKPNSMGFDLSGLEPKLIKLEFIIYLPKLKVSMCLEICGFEPIIWLKSDNIDNKWNNICQIDNKSVEKII